MVTPPSTRPTIGVGVHAPAEWLSILKRTSHINISLGEKKGVYWVTKSTNESSTGNHPQLVFWWYASKKEFSDQLFRINRSATSSASSPGWSAEIEIERSGNKLTIIARSPTRKW